MKKYQTTVVAIFNSVSNALQERSCRKTQAELCCSLAEIIFAGANCNRRIMQGFSTNWVRLDCAGF